MTATQSRTSDNEARKSMKVRMVMRMAVIDKRRLAIGRCKERCGNDVRKDYLYINDENG